MSLALQGGAELGFQKTRNEVVLKNAKFKGVCAGLSLCKARNEAVAEDVKSKGGKGHEAEL